MLANIALLCYNNYSDKERVIICVLKGILDVCFSVKSAQGLLEGFILQGVQSVEKVQQKLGFFT